MTVLSLFLIGFGTGGIKPCVVSFGGDQFEEHQVGIEGTDRNEQLFCKSGLIYRPIIFMSFTKQSTTCIL